MFEIEHRGILTKDAYEQLKARLEESAELLGADDKEVTYYIYPDKLLKAVRNISQKTAKISLKLDVLGRGSAFREIEVPFAENDYGKLRDILDNLAQAEQVIPGTQRRTNYRYKGVDIALKWSEDWQYHVELEVVIDDKRKKNDADALIQDVALAFGVTLMNEQEVADFTEKIRSAKR